MNKQRPTDALPPFADWPIAIRLSAIVLTLLVPGTLVITATVLTLLQQSMTAQVGENLNTVAQSTAHNVADHLTHRISNLQSLARSQTLVNDVMAANATYPASEAFAHQKLVETDKQWEASGPDNPIAAAIESLPSSLDLRIFSEADPAFTDLHVADRYGGLVAFTTLPHKYDQSGEVWWRVAYNDGQGSVYISPPFFKEEFSTYLLSVAVPVFRPGSAEVIGVVHAEYRLAALADLLGELQIGQTGEALLLTSDGRRIDTSVSGHERISASEWSHVPPPGGPKWWTASFLSRDSLITIAPVTSHENERITEMNWVVVIRQDFNESFAAQQSVVRLASLLALAGLIVVAAFTVIVARSLVRPIADLTRIAQEAQRGNYEITAPVSGRDEIGQLASAFNAMIAEINKVTGSLEAQVSERTAQLAAVNDIAATVSANLDINQVMSASVNLIRDRLGYYHASIFLLDEKGEYAVLRESTGEAGRLLKERGHRLGVGSQSIIGHVTARRKPRVALDVGTDTAHFKNPLLPNTRSELAIPLMVGDRLLGALDVQSTEPSAFGDDDVAVLQNMANQIAIAINNARLFQESQAQLAEISALNRQYLARAWENFARTRSESVSLQLEGGLVVPAPELMTRESSVRITAPRLSEDRGTISVPITLRDEVIGEFSLSAPAGEAQWGEDDVALVEAVVTQVALAVDNARLLEETQAALAESNRLARRERLISEITNKITYGADVKRILQIAADELRRATGSSRAVVKLAAVSDEESAPS